MSVPPSRRFPVTITLEALALIAIAVIVLIALLNGWGALTL